jgi:RND family efflux transporter MFP subunit
MKILPISSRTFYLLLVLLPLLIAFAYVATQSGPLASVPVTVIQVEKRAITPALFGIGTVEARYRYRVGPTMTGRLLSLNSDVGDTVTLGQLLGEMDPVDMTDKIAANKAAIKGATASVTAAQAHVEEASARANYAHSQSRRYRQLAEERSVSKETSEAKSQEYQVSKASLAAAKASLNAAQQALEKIRADNKALLKQYDNLQLLSPANGIVASRNIEPGSTAIAGEIILEIINPKSIWINVRFSQLQSDGLTKGLPANIVLRSRSNHIFSGKIERIELLADSITEETLAKVTFDQLPDPFPPLGELTEVTVSLPPLDETPVLPNGCIKQVNGKEGIWHVEDKKLQFTEVETGVSDLKGQIQIIKGLEPGDTVVLYSSKELTARSRITTVDQIAEIKQ